MTTTSQDRHRDLSTAKSDPIVRRREQCVARLLDQAEAPGRRELRQGDTRWKGKGAARKASTPEEISGALLGQGELVDENFSRQISTR